MTKAQILNRMLGVATLAMLFGMPAAHAQDELMIASKHGMEAQDSDMHKSGTSGDAAAQSGTSGTSGASGEAASGAAGATSGGMAGASADAKALSKQDRKMMNDLAQANMAEIAASRLALEKSKDDQVQAFAQKMIDDHTAASDKLQQLAQQKGMTLPKEMDRAHQADMKQLQKLSGDKFDKQYLSEYGRKDHREVHQMLSKIEKQAQDQDLKQLAADLKPTIGQHLDMAQRLHGADAATKASGASGDAGSGMGGSATVTGRPGGNTVELGNQPDAGSSGGAATDK